MSDQKKNPSGSGGPGSAWPEEPSRQYQHQDGDAQEDQNIPDRDMTDLLYSPKIPSFEGLKRLQRDESGTGKKGLTSESTTDPFLNDVSKESKLGYVATESPAWALSVDDIVDCPKKPKSDNAPTEIIIIQTGKVDLMCWFCGTFILLTGFLLILFTRRDDNMLWLSQPLKVIAMMITMWLCGAAVVYKGVSVAYSRKFLHACFLIWPQLMDFLVTDFDRKDIYNELWNMWVAMLMLLIMAKPFRAKFNACKVMFASIDRPEDRPKSLLWLSTQLVVTLGITAPFGVLFATEFHHPYWIFIPIIINAIGDGLAEPIGQKYGKHTYRANPVCGGNEGKEYVRSLEGSAVVFIVSVISVAMFYNTFTTFKFIINIVVIPVSVTLAEALSPHVWDGPGIVLVTCTVLTLTHLLHESALA